MKFSNLMIVGAIFAVFGALLVGEMLNQPQVAKLDKDTTVAVGACWENSQLDAQNNCYIKAKGCSLIACTNTEPGCNIPSYNNKEVKGMEEVKKNGLTSYTCPFISYTYYLCNPTKVYDDKAKEWVLISCNQDIVKQRGTCPSNNYLTQTGC